MNIPKLRFPEFSGEWKKEKLSDIVTLMQSGLSRKLEEKDIGLPVLRSNNLIDNRLDLSDIRYWYDVDDKGANLANYFLKKGDLLVNFINSINQIGKTALYKGEIKRNTIFTTNIMRLNFNSNTNVLFIYYCFQTKKYFDYIQSITKPAVNQASFTTVDFKRFELDLPPLSEQEKIASFLTKVDEKIGFIEKSWEQWEMYKKGVMQNIFNLKLKFKDENGKHYPKWRNKKLKDVSSINPKSQNFPDKFIYIDLESVESGVLKKMQIMTKDEAPNRAQRVLSYGDILFQTVRPYQKNNLFFNINGNENYVASTGYAQISANENSKFLYYQ